MFFTEDEEYLENLAIQKDDNFILANETALEEESDEYQKGYMNALTAQQRQYSFRNRDVPINPIQKRKEVSAPNNDAPIAQKKGKDVANPTTRKSPATNERSNQPIISRDKDKKKDVPVKYAKKVSVFSLENEISKLKVSIPLTELMKNNSYKGQVSKILNFDPMSDMVNVEDDQPELIFGPALDGESPDSDVPPFYISLILHDFVLHNAMFDSGASHNLMPRAIMEKLGLDITRKYHDLYSFDSSRVRCIWLIKYLVVILDQIPTKNVFMDVVVADIPPRFGMLLSRSWGAKMKGTL